MMTAGGIGTCLFAALVSLIARVVGARAAIAIANSVTLST
jgi:hypothetical protein